MVELVYLARLREVFGSSRETVELPDDISSVSGLLEWLRSRGGAWARELAPGRALRAGNAAVGAVASFVGIVRDLNDAAKVSTLTLEHYPGMTEKALSAIVDDAKRRWDLYDVLIV